MSLATMYPAKNNSPTTVLTADIGSSDTTMTVDDTSVLPAAPNIAVIGSSTDAEIVKYTEISGSTLTIVRGQNSTTPGVWPAGTAVARNYTALDHEIFRENILDLDERKTDSGHTHDDRYYTETEMNTAMALKAPLSSPALAGTPTAPTAASGTDTQQIATTAFVQATVTEAKILIVDCGTISSLPKTVSNAKIKADMEPLPIGSFSSSSAMTGDWTVTPANGSVTISGSINGSTTLKVYLVSPQ